jgi:pantoate--beta-alanine ligase
VKLIKEIQALQLISDFHKADYKKIGLVPTMGFLHEGHLSLISKARQECDIVIVSIFVNPIQFLPGEDFSDYPRDFVSDYHSCRIAGADYLFYPDSEQMYPDGFLTEVKVKDLSDRLEGNFRPGHFCGVTTVVQKLINIAKPSVVYFGQKDVQQAAIINKMRKDLNIDIEIQVCETVREESGLAMSSRNIYLTDDEKSEAVNLYKTLSEGKKLILDENWTDMNALKQNMETYLKSNAPNIRLQYIAITDMEVMRDIENLNNYKGNVIISLAAFIGKTRLIDNIIFNYN